MKKYLEDFFVCFDYNKDDAAFLINTYDKIAANGETITLFKEAISIYEESINCDYQKIIELADKIAEELYLREYTVELLVLICLTKKAKQVYRQRNIDEKIYYDTMLDLRYKLDECKLVKGVIGTFVSSWFSHIFKLEIFALGRLQFEVVNFGENYQKNGYKLTPESKVINIHIPRTLTPLYEQSCEEAIEQAKEFFADKFDGVFPFVCYSWLLYYENEQILPHHTNIYKFFARFDIFKTDIKKDNNEIWRLFDTDERNPDRLPANTSVRRAYIEHLKKGGKTGDSYGVFFR